jgi:hypothetical protein
LSVGQSLTASQLCKISYRRNVFFGCLQSAVKIGLQTCGAVINIFLYDSGNVIIVALPGWLLSLESLNLREYLTNASDAKAFLAPNTSDQELMARAKERLAENGIQQDRIEINYDIQQLNTGDIYISYDPPDLVVRVVYEKKPSGIVKMKSVATIKL